MVIIKVLELDEMYLKILQDKVFCDFVVSAFFWSKVFKNKTKLIRLCSLDLNILIFIPIKINIFNILIGILCLLS